MNLPVTLSSGPCPLCGRTEHRYYNAVDADFFDPTTCVRNTQAQMEEITMWRVRKGPSQDMKAMEELAAVLSEGLLQMEVLLGQVSRHHEEHHETPTTCERVGDGYAHGALALCTMCRDRLGGK